MKTNATLGLILGILAAIFSDYSWPASEDPSILTQEHFSKTATIKDDDLELMATISTEEGYKERHGIFRIVWDDNFLRAFVNKKTGKVNYQVIVRVYYEDSSWRFYSFVNYQTPTGLESKSLDLLYKEPIACSGSSCTYVEVVGFDIPESLLVSIRESYQSNYAPPWAWKFKLKAKNGVDLTQGILPAEVVGLLDRVNQYFSDSPALAHSTEQAASQNAEAAVPRPAPTASASSPVAKSKLKFGINGGGDADIPLQVKKMIGDPKITGFYVLVIEPGSVAQASGLVLGDEILEVDGHSTRSRMEMGEIVKTIAPGAKVALKVLRKGETLSLVAAFPQ